MCVLLLQDPTKRCGLDRLNLIYAKRAVTGPINGPIRYPRLCRSGTNLFSPFLEGKTFPVETVIIDTGSVLKLFDVDLDLTGSVGSNSNVFRVCRRCLVFFLDSPEFEGFACSWSWTRSFESCAISCGISPRKAESFRFYLQMRGAVQIDRLVQM